MGWTALLGAAAGVWEWVIAHVHAVAVVLLCLVCFCGGCACARGEEPKVAIFDPQRKAYDDLVKSLKPGNIFEVYVGTDPAFKPYVRWVRWDAYPAAKGRAKVVGIIAEDGNPYECQTPQAPPLAAQLFRPLAWTAGCPSGTCRGR